MPPSRRVLWLAVPVLAALLAIACRTETQPVGVQGVGPRATVGPPRSYLLGFSATPHELTDRAYAATFDLAAQYGELLLLQRPPAWQSFLPEATVAPTLRDQTLTDRDAARARGLKLMVVLDVFDPAARERLNALPSELRDRQLDDPDLRAALIAEAVFIARNEQPDYLGIGSEVNATFERNPAGYAQFLSVYAEAYDAVKLVAPEIVVFPTFQYEQLLGVIPWEPPHTPRWELLDQFAGRLDLFAVTSYPSFAYQVARKVPPQYYREIRDHTDLPVALVSVGYSSGQVRDGMNSSTPPEQRRFLQRLFEDADWLGAPIVIWFAARDLTFATSPPYDLLQTIGLRDVEDRPKEAWPAWVTAAHRPYDPAAAERERREARAAEPTPAPTETGTSEPTATATPAGG